MCGEGSGVLKALIGELESGGVFPQLNYHYLTHPPTPAHLSLYERREEEEEKKGNKVAREERRSPGI